MTDATALAGKILAHIREGERVNYASIAVAKTRLEEWANDAASVERERDEARAERDAALETIATGPVSQAVMGAMRAFWSKLLDRKGLELEAAERRNADLARRVAEMETDRRNLYGAIVAHNLDAALIILTSPSPPASSTEGKME